MRGRSNCGLSALVPLVERRLPNVHYSVQRPPWCSTHEGQCYTRWNAHHSPLTFRDRNRRSRRPASVAYFDERPLRTAAQHACVASLSTKL